MIKLIIFDFSMTLTSDLYFSSLPLKEREIVTDLIFSKRNKEQWDTPWMKGVITHKDITDYLSKHLPYSSQELQTLLIEDIKRIRFNRNIRDFAMKARPQYKTAIATINNDVFSEFVVPQFKLNNHFDVIVNSSDYGITDKVGLCDLIMECCNIPSQFKKCLLIDDSAKNVRNFIQREGHGHVYKSDRDFGDWLANQTVLDRNCYEI